MLPTVIMYPHRFTDGQLFRLVFSPILYEQPTVEFNDLGLCFPLDICP